MRERSYQLTVVLLAAAMFAGLWAYLRQQQRAAVAAAGAIAAETSTDREPSLRPPHPPIAEVARLLRSLKLVTVEVRTRVESSRVDESWRGDVRASVAAPVRLLYGCDLTDVADESSASGAGLRPNALTRGYTLRVPRPVRLAAEIDGDGEGEHTDVQVGWGRFRDLAGEYQLGLARAGLHARARQLVLSPAQQREMEQTTRRQLVALVRAFAAGGDRVDVDVEFFDAGDSRSEYVTAPADRPRDGAVNAGGEGP